jgi:hypothetical protein
MSISVDVFLEYKDYTNVTLKSEFTKRFTYILNKFESLSKANAYKKIQRVNIIKIPKTDNNILNLLNKITDVNYNVISQKILLKLTDTNVVFFIEQIFLYVEKSSSNNISLWSLIKLLVTNPLTSDSDKQVIIEKLRMFIDRFLEYFEVDSNDRSTDTSSEDYLEFVERNKNNVVILSKMHMVYIMITDDQHIFELNNDINVFFTILMNKLSILIGDNNIRNDNIIYVLMECILMIVKDPVIKKNPYAHKRFINSFGNDHIKKNLTNKIRFKLMDIIDYIKNGL